MITLNELESEFTKIAYSIWNDAPTANFIPSMDLSFGDVYSNYCILLAKKYKESTNAIFDKIKKEFDSQLDLSREVSISLIGEYLNVKFNNIFIKDFETSFAENSIKQIVIFVPLIEGYTQSLFFRLASKAFLQKQLAEKFNVKSKLFLGDGLKEIKDNNVVDFFKTAGDIYNEVKKDIDVLNVISEIVNKNSCDLFFIYLGFNAFYQKKLTREIFKSEEKRKKFIIKFSSKDWSNILPEDDDELSIFIKQGNDENVLKNLIFILSKNNDFHEVNWLSSEIDEQDNFIYFFHSTLERMKKISVESFDLDVFESKDFEDCNARSIIIRLYFLNRVLLSSVLSGSVGDFIEYFDTLLRDLNYILNSPNIRYQIVNNQCSKEVKFIFNYAKVVFHKIFN